MSKRIEELVKGNNTLTKQIEELKLKDIEQEKIISDLRSELHVAKDKIYTLTRATEAKENNKSQLSGIAELLETNMSVVMGMGKII